MKRRSYHHEIVYGHLASYRMAHYWLRFWYNNLKKGVFPFVHKDILQPEYMIPSKELTLMMHRATIRL